MKPYVAKTPAAGQDSRASQELSIAITLKSPEGMAPTKLLARASSESISALKPHPLSLDHAIAVLRKKGFIVSGRGSMTLSVRGSKTLYEKVFGTQLTEVQLPRQMAYSSHAVFYPAEGAQWSPDPEVADVIDDAYIQWPHIYMAKTGAAAKRAQAAKPPSKAVGKRVAATSSAKKARPPTTGVSASPPKVTGYYNLDVLKDVPRLLGVSKIHQAGNKGQGVRVVMIDTGFAHSPVLRSQWLYLVRGPGAQGQQSNHRSSEPRDRRVCEYLRDRAASNLHRREARGRRQPEWRIDDPGGLPGSAPPHAACDFHQHGL